MKLVSQVKIVQFYFDSEFAIITINHDRLKTCIFCKAIGIVYKTSKKNLSAWLGIKGKLIWKAGEE